MSSNPETSPLTDLHRRLGANMIPYRGAEAAQGCVADYGDPAAEREALGAACGLVDRSWVSGLEMLGADRTRFLGGYVTCDVKGLEPGAGAYGFVTGVKGRVLADPVVLALDDRLWLELPPGKAQEISEHLSKYVIVDRVEIRTLEDMVPLSLVGPRSAEVLGSVVEPLEEVWSHRVAEVLGTGVRLVREPSLAVGEREIPAWTLWVAAGGAEALFGALLDHGAASGLMPVGHLALDALRVEAGRPLYGVDFDGANFPQETGLEEQAVSYDKGCYLGQEVVARIHYRGGVNRHLRGLVFGGEVERVADLIGRAVLAGGREAGKVTSAAEAGAGAIGLAILHRRAEPGSPVELAGGGTARVVELPFRPAKP